MADSSFDIVSKIDRQEADNALNQARKEVEQRYDFKGTDASIDWSGDAILIKANSEERAKAVLDVFQGKLIKRGVSLSTTYNHLQSFAVRSGKVKRGQVIGYTGTTGSSTGCHLHFETRTNGTPVDPRGWL